MRLKADSEDCSACVNRAKADLNLCWAHMHYCRNVVPQLEYHLGMT